MRKPTPIPKAIETLKSLLPDGWEIAPSALGRPKGFAGEIEPAQGPLHMEPMAYSVEEAALVMSLSRTAVYSLIKDGLLKSVHQGKRRIIPRTEIQAYLDAHAR